jgi:rRNA biogenesis protein RRP5
MGCANNDWMVRVDGLETLLFDLNEGPPTNSRFSLFTCFPFMNIDSDDKFAHGSIVMCRVLATVPKKPIVDISCRESRIEGDLEDDEPPQVGDTMQAYVKSTTKKGCFLRLSRQIDGRVLLKELSDGFVPDPVASFPQGRLVVGKVKSIQEIESSKRKTCCKFKVEFDMRESTLLDAQAKIKFQAIQVGSKYKGTVTRIEDYGVFVQLQNSEISGLTHKSECSDKYIKKLQDLYDPGDMVKVLVLKKDEEKKQIGFSMKASHFADDESSDDSSIAENVSDSEEDDDEEQGGGLEKDVAVDSDDELDSGDENFVSKLAAKHAKTELDDSDEEMDDAESKESEEESDNDSDNDDDDDDDIGDQDNLADTGMDTNVGFDWDVTGQQSTDKSGANSDGDDDNSCSDDSENSEDGVQKSSHKSRKKQAQKRREEQEIARRETALADGTADENPETASDFERLLASSPNSSELWIRYMAFHLTLADISSARQVAERALQRIEFRLEREKLNVWCALLTLELKYGNEKSLKHAMDRACAQVNPKHVHLRVCEIMEKEANMAPGPVVQERTDDMYNRMCKKFKSKKKVWLAHAEYLLKRKRHDEALALSKRALLSLAAYKHVEMMSKFAQLVFEYGSAEQARTLFDGLLTKCPKRLDLLFVYADKEIKHGDVEMARSLFASVTAAATSTTKEKGTSASSSSSARKMKLSDKQMKNLFKRWYGFEEKHGTDESRDQVKDAARAYVEGS